MKNRNMEKFYEYFRVIMDEVDEALVDYSSMVINENTFENIKSGYASLDYKLDRCRNNLFGALEFMHMMKYCTLDEYMTANSSICVYFSDQRRSLNDIEEHLFSSYIDGDSESAAC